MTKAAPMQTSYNAGEFSPIMEGHINLEKFSDSARLMQNLIPLKQGSMVRRGGTKFAKEVKDSSKDTLLLEFEFNVTDAYVIEMGDQYFRFYKDNGIITEAAQNITAATQANPVVVTYSGADNYANGDEVYISGVEGMTELNGKFYLVANVDTGANTFELTDIDGNNIDGTGFTAYSANGTVEEVYEVASPYLEADLIDSNGQPQFQIAQSADVLYIVHNSYEPRSLGRVSDTNWTLTTMDFIDGAYLPENDETTTLTLGGTTGSVSVTASATTGINGGDGFQTTDVGRLIRWQDPANNWTWLEITGHTSTTIVTATIKGEDASATTATTEWRLGVFSDTTGWPDVITFHEDRVFLSGSTDYPDRWDLSRTGGYSDTEFRFAPSDADGTVTDNASINGTIQSGKVNVIQWAATDSKGLVMGTAAREWVVRPDENNAVLTPTNAKSDPFSSIGSTYVQPISIESGIVFVQRARRRLHDIIYSFEQDSLKPRDLTIASEHITKTGVAQLVFQQEPVNCVWMRLTDGSLRGMTYYPDEGVFGVHRHVIGGTDVAIKSLAAIPAADASRDELWMIVERTINGTTRKYVEYMTRYYEDDIELQDTIHVDSALTYDSPVTVSGATQADPVVITATAHGFSDGDFVDFAEVGGMTELNGNRYKVANSTANTFELNNNDDANIDGTGFTAYTSGGEVRQAVTSVSGLDHLEGETVKVLLDGKSHPDLTVTSGAITLANSQRGGVMQIGLSNTWAFQSQRIEAGARDGTAQGKTKRITGIVVRLLNTLGLYYGRDSSNTTEYDFDNALSYDETPTLFSGDTPFLRWTEGYEQEGFVYLAHDGAFPATILAHMPYVTTYDR